MSIQHIPAWKRLGLKLKHANNKSELQDTDTKSSLKYNKRKANWEANGSSNHHRQLKKSRHDVDTSKDELSRGKHHPRPANSNHSKPKKSVSFTTDTKVEDGDSAQTIQFMSPDLPGSKPSDTTPSNKSADNVGIDSLVTARKKPKVKRSKPKETSKLALTPRKATAALDYLQQFRNDRPTWKFNKNHETWLLKHMLSTEFIAPSFNYYLAFYVAQLRSKGARQRLTEQSRTVLAKQPSQISHLNDDYDHEKSKLVKLLNTEPDELSSSESEWLEGADRAALVLWSLDDIPQGPSPDNMAVAKAVFRTKKNKSRTSRIDVDVSSSSENEDDTSSSESDDQRKGSMRRPTGGDQVVSNDRGINDVRMESDDESVTSTTSSDSASTSDSKVG